VAPATGPDAGQRGRLSLALQWTVVDEALGHAPRPTRLIATGGRAMTALSDYDEIGVGYADVRFPDLRIQHAVDAALGSAERVVNVGAGAGSYEPVGRCIAAVEPSTVMISQRPAGLAPVVRAVAEALPFSDASADVALAVNTVMHWRDLGRGVAEMRRVADRTVILTVDPAVVGQLWIISDYAPEMASTHVAALPSLRELTAALPGAEIREVAVARDCTDGFLAAFWGRPEAYLDPAIRRATSPWHQISAAAAERAVERLSADLADGTWDARYGHLRSAPTHDVGLRLVIGA
jgi:SAM-dependent methyltransferase